MFHYPLNFPPLGNIKNINFNMKDLLSYGELRNSLTTTNFIVE